MTTIPMILAAGPLVGYFVGQWADERFGWDPWGKIGLGLLGFVAGFKQVVSIIKNWIKESEKD